MAVIWAIGEIADGVPTKLTLELATLARSLAEQAGGESQTVLIGAGAAKAAEQVAPYAGSVLTVDVEPGTAAGPAAAVVAPRLAAMIEERKPDYLLLGASNDGKDIAGMLVGLTDLPVLVSGAGVDWGEDGPLVEMSTFGGKLVTHSAFTGGRGMIIVRPATVSAEKGSAPGKVESVDIGVANELPAVKVAKHVEEAGAAAPIEEARIIVGGGRGVGAEDGFKLVEELAEALAPSSPRRRAFETPST